MYPWEKDGLWFYNRDPKYPTLDYYQYGKVEGEPDYFVPVSGIRSEGPDSLVKWMWHLSEKDWFAGRAVASFIQAAVEAGVVVVRETDRRGRGYFR
jgi:hypothetical protein